MSAASRREFIRAIDTALAIYENIKLHYQPTKHNFELEFEIRFLVHKIRKDVFLKEFEDNSTDKKYSDMIEDKVIYYKNNHSTNQRIRVIQRKASISKLDKTFDSKKLFGLKNGRKWKLIGTAMKTSPLANYNEM